MPTFSAPDGTELAYHVFGDGRPLVCLPGGPMRDSIYLGDLGGLTAHRQVIRLDLRGTGQSAAPADTGSYRCDRLVDDVDALREHFGLDQMDLLAHSGGTNLATLYAARYPQYVSKLALITPSPFAVGIAVTAEMRRDTALLRHGEPWFPEAFAALEAIFAGQAGDDQWQAIEPFRHGRWDDAAQALHATDGEQKNSAAAVLFGADGAFEPDATRAALARFPAPVLLLAGEVDLNSPPPAVAEFAGLFPNARLVIQPGAGHFPWLDDPDRFLTTTVEFLE